MNSEIEPVGLEVTIDSGKMKSDLEIQRRLELEPKG
jgi:hypothetical protein